MLTWALVASTSQGFWIHCPPWNLKQAHFSPCKTLFIQGKLVNTAKHFTQSRKICGLISTDRGCKTLNSNQLWCWLSDLSTRWTQSTWRAIRATPILLWFSSWIQNCGLILWLIRYGNQPSSWEDDKIKMLFHHKWSLKYKKFSANRANKMIPDNLLLPSYFNIFAFFNLNLEIWAHQIYGSSRRKQRRPEKVFA